MPEHREIEAKFLEVDAEAVTRRLIEFSARDFGEDHIQEVIIYDREGAWAGEERMVRIRKARGKVVVSYKHHQERVIGGTEEIEFEASDYENAKRVFEAVGLVAYREQEKKRHTFELSGVKIEFDTWPKIPTYMEVEGKSEEQVRQVSEQLGMDWSKAVFKSAGKVIEEDYGIPIMGYRHFTFSKMG